MENIKRRKYLLPVSLYYNYLIFSFILIGVISICGCANKGIRVLDFMGNSKESGFVEFYTNFENKPKHPSFNKFLVYKYNKRGDKLFTEPIGSGIRIIEKPGIHTYFIKGKESVKSKKVVVTVVDKMTIPITINVYFGTLKSTKILDPFEIRDIEYIKQYFFIEVSTSESFSELVSSDSSDIAEKNVIKGVDFAAQGKFKEAKEAFEKALKAGPHNPSREEYLKVVEDAIDKKIERKAAIHIFRGNTCFFKRQIDEGIEEYSKAVKINPKYALSYNNRGLAYYFKREYDKAWQDVNKAQSLGFQVHPGFLKALRKASGRQK